MTTPVKFRPILAYKEKPKKPLVLADLIYPLLGFFKYDGIRAVKPGAVLSSRKLKPIPNKAICKKFAACKDMDGELIAGDPTAEDCYHKTESQVMTINGSADGISFYLFDHLKNLELPYTKRLKNMEVSALFMKTQDIRFAPYVVLHNATEAEEFRKKAARLNYEGIMLRSPDGRYKCGRSTLREQYLVAVKPFQDSEARVLGVYPREHNANKQQRDALGYSKRSSHKAGKMTMAMVGGFNCIDLKTKVKFNCGTGVFKKEYLEQLWKIKHELKGKILKYRFTPVGVKEKPRHPRALGWRSRIDL